MRLSIQDAVNQLVADGVGGSGGATNKTIYQVVAEDIESPQTFSVSIPESPTAEAKYSVCVYNAGAADVTIKLQNGTDFGVDGGDVLFGDIIPEFVVTPEEHVYVNVNGWLVGTAARIVASSASNINLNVEVRGL